MRRHGPAATRATTPGAGAPGGQPGEPDFEPDFEPDDGPRDERGVVIPTEYYRDASRSIIAHNDSPDVGFDAQRQPLPRLRARLHLLLRAAVPRVPRLLGRASTSRRRSSSSTTRPQLLREELLPSRRGQPQTLALSRRDRSATSRSSGR